MTGSRPGELVGDTTAEELRLTLALVAERKQREKREVDRANRKAR